MNAGVLDLCGVSAATANRILAKLVKEGKLIKRREGGHWAYRLNDGYQRTHEIYETGAPSIS